MLKHVLILCSFLFQCKVGEGDRHLGSLIEGLRFEPWEWKKLSSGDPYILQEPPSGPIKLVELLAIGSGYWLSH